MPIYEYQCYECEIRFELLRPSREASFEQPCPSCDAESKRVMSKQWSAFTFRDGHPRRLPDDGGYWHLGKKVTQPNIRGARPGEHPEITKRKPKEALSVEELEKYEYRKEREAEFVVRAGYNPVAFDPADKDIGDRIGVEGTNREETVKRRVTKTARQLHYKKKSVEE